MPHVGPALEDQHVGLDRVGAEVQCADGPEQARDVTAGRVVALVECRAAHPAGSRREEEGHEVLGRGAVGHVVVAEALDALARSLGDGVGGGARVAPPHDHEAVDVVELGGLQLGDRGAHAVAVQHDLGAVRDRGARTLDVLVDARLHVLDDLVEHRGLRAQAGRAAIGQRAGVEAESVEHQRGLTAAGELARVVVAACALEVPEPAAGPGVVDQDVDPGAPGVAEHLLARSDEAAGDGVDLAVGQAGDVGVVVVVEREHHLARDHPLRVGDRDGLAGDRPDEGAGEGADEQTRQQRARRAAGGAGCRAGVGGAHGR